ncbi:Uncharacterised protein [uncultured archaeon]|nr:Uncharacterised protein [uncultured archaeon]
MRLVKKKQHDYIKKSDLFFSMDKVVHFEIPVEDIERAKSFYRTTFGWEIIGIPEMDYNFVHTCQTDEDGMISEKGAINGGIRKKNEIIKSPVITINVSDINEALFLIEKNGGKMIIKNKVGNIGFSAYFEDTEGNVIGLWQSIPIQEILDASVQEDIDILGQNIHEEKLENEKTEEKKVLLNEI